MAAGRRFPPWLRFGLLSEMNAIWNFIGADQAP